MTRAAIIEESAARWIVRREGEDWSAADEQDLAAWLDEGMAHRAAFWRLQHGWNEADRIAALGDLPPAPTPRALRRWPAMVRARPALAGAIAATLALVIGLGGYAWRSATVNGARAQTIALHTPVGGQRTVSLDDGSRIELNTATLLRTTERPGGREVWLDRGEAFFDIAHRADHPFVVHAGSRTVTVLGTRFSVRREGEKVTVAVVSGRVRVDDATHDGTGGRAAVIGAGDIAFVRPHATLVAVASPAHVGNLTAWRDGLLVFDHARLADAVADFNRYTTRPIRIDDPRTADIRIGGAFRVDNSAGFLDLLHSAYGLTIRSEADKIVVEP